VWLPSLSDAFFGREGQWPSGCSKAASLRLLRSDSGSRESIKPFSLRFFSSIESWKICKVFTSVQLDYHPDYVLRCSFTSFDSGEERITAWITGLSIREPLLDSLPIQSIASSYPLARGRCSVRGVGAV
jgi:hypothetical protein